MTGDAELNGLARELAKVLGTRSLQLATAESCTGGWVGKVLTEIPGSSSWYLGGIVSYSNALKTTLLGVQPGTLETHGAVSPETAREMAIGAIERCGGTCGLSVTGVAGPDGGTAQKPVGLVWFGWAVKRGEQIAVHTAQERFAGDRDAVRRQAVARALRGMTDIVTSNG
jgi:nicotinamide-nucleotide amidase